MSTTPTSPVPTAPTVAPVVPTPPPADPPATPAATSDPVQLPEDHPLVKAYAAEREKNKTLKATIPDAEELKRLRDIEAATKTQAEKDAEELARLRDENTGYKTREQIEAWAKEVSTETDVPASLLRGRTKEELLAHAEQLKPLIGQQAPPPAPGTVSTIGNTPVIPNVSLTDQIAEAEKDGDHRRAIALKRQLAAETNKTS